MQIRYVIVILLAVGALACINFAESGTLEGFELQANGLFVPRKGQLKSPEFPGRLRSASSENGAYECRYSYSPAGTVKDLVLFRGGEPVFSLPETQAHSVKTSGQGYLLLTRISRTEGTRLEFNIYSREGREVFLKSYLRPEASGFSRSGDRFWVCGRENLEVITLASGFVQKFRTAKKVDISHDGTVVALAYDKGVSVYIAGRLVKQIYTGFLFNRDIRLTPDKKRLAVAGRKEMRLYSLPGGGLLYSHKLKRNETFRNLLLDDSTLKAGIKYEDGEVRRGILHTYTLKEGPGSFTRSVLAEELVRRSGFEPTALQKTSSRKKTQYASVPWPFMPQDQPHRLWNAYEGLNTDLDGNIRADWGFPYLHQGLDIEVDSNQACYSVDTGVVKYMGDMGGAGELSWRLAVSHERGDGYANGWMYAHLVESSINYDEGDHISSVGLHLADIIPWYGNVDAHMHFANIRDHGTTWSFSDDEWGITYNPLLSLAPNPDSTPPVIQTAMSGKSKFAYVPNNSGYGALEEHYLFPDSGRGGVSGDIDIVVDIYDYVVYENFTHPAYEIFYWIKGIDQANAWSNYGELVIDTTLGQVLNHAYPFYEEDKIMPYSRVLYQADSVFTAGGWFNRTRTYAHVLTNNNGDSLVTLGEEDSCLHSADYFDGWYRVFVKACDVAGNCALDSEDVYFNNANPDTTEPAASVQDQKTASFFLSQHSIHQFNFVTAIRYGIPRASRASLVIYDCFGSTVKTLASGLHEAKEYLVPWDGTDNSGLRVSPGMYICRLENEGRSAVRKMVYSRKYH
jgi:hypothetical protein